MEAPEFFAEHYPKLNISKALQQLPEEIQVKWESERVHPEYSPGPVSAEETVCRALVSPTHYNPDSKEIKPTAFDDAANKGLSIDRLAHAPLDAILKKAQGRVDAHNAKEDRREDRSLIGYSTFMVVDLRNVKVGLKPDHADMRRGIGVYDTALKSEPEHADVCQIAPNSQGGRSARSRLFALANATFVLSDEKV